MGVEHIPLEFLWEVDFVDPALFIQARTGAGYTLNFGKSLAWPIPAAVFGYFVFLVFLDSITPEVAGAAA